jgi:hypothetical protein
MKKQWLKILVLLLALSPILNAQTRQKVVLDWSEPVTLFLGTDSTISSVAFENSRYFGLPDQILPFSVTSKVLPAGNKLNDVHLSDITYIPLTEQDQLILGSTEIPAFPSVDFKVLLEKGNPTAIVNVLPFGINPESGKIEKILSFTIDLVTEQSSPALKSAQVYANNSVLAMGDWYKIFIAESGVHIVTYDDLKNLGINMSGLNPDKIRIFGNGGAMLNTLAGNLTADDLTENALKVVTANPGVFAQGDYILFYGQGTQTWAMNALTARMEHTTHLYADEACYFVNVGLENGRRLSVDETPAGNPDYFTNEYTAVFVYEKELLNLIKSGRKWFSQKMDFYNRTISLPRATFANTVPGQSAVMRYGIAGRSIVGEISFNFLVNNQVVGSSSLSKVGTASISDYARDLTTSASFIPPSGQMDLQVRFNPSSSTDLGWLDFVSLNVRCYLKFTGGQMSFRDPKTFAPGRLTEFTLSDANAVTEIWDVSDPLNVSLVDFSRNGNNLILKSNTSVLREFVAHDGTSFKRVSYGSKIANQNLHSIGNYDLVIVTHPDFKKPAQTLAAAHNEIGEIAAIVVSLPEIYNEFSSGIQDITAIRNFMKMLYDRGHEAGYPKYLLLFGNASYDVKNRISGNANFVPTFQSENSTSNVFSFLSDDYFVLLDDEEGGNSAWGLLDMAVGRMPVRNLEQANVAVQKTIAYLKNDKSTHGDWRNVMMVIADDQDKNTHLNQSERLTDSIAENHPVYGIDKVYFDAYKQISTPGGSRYPDVNREIVTKVEKGALLVNYIGHGGEVGWADERVLEIADINAWTNFGRMGLFFTATCEFSRFDNPVHISAGELVFLNPDGGAMSMITTTRLAFSSSNAALNLSFADTVFSTASGIIPRLGDILKFTKNQNGTDANTRHLTLFGDPSLKMPIPQHKVVTTSITNANTGMLTDTLFATSLITVAGEVRNVNNQVMDGFNGEVQVKVFDKPSKIKTLGQDSDSYAVEFTMQKNILYQGKATVNNGLFNFTFLVPRDIDYSYGKGKLSYYATNGLEDGHGFSDDFIIGGAQSIIQQDFTGPEIRLFMNDTNFIDGGIVSENPKFLAFLYDESGINTIGTGIGHDLVATIDGDNYSSVVLNDYYITDIDSYQSGSLIYKYFNLPEGEHVLSLKAWDIFNNSSEANIRFEVKRNIILAVDEVLAFPNPTAGPVSFRFGHNQFDGRFDVEVEIYSTTGVLVRSLGPLKVFSEGYESGSIFWDGNMANGAPVRAGMYLARLKVRDRNGNTTFNTVKIINTRQL